MTCYISVIQIYYNTLFVGVTKDSIKYLYTSLVSLGPYHNRIKNARKMAVSSRILYKVHKFSSISYHFIRFTDRTGLEDVLDL